MFVAFLYFLIPEHAIGSIYDHFLEYFIWGACVYVCVCVCVFSLGVGGQ